MADLTQSGSKKFDQDPSLTLTESYHMGRAWVWNVGLVIGNYKNGSNPGWPLGYYFFPLKLRLYFRNFLFNFFREQPIFTCKAHVFHIDPKTKRSWLAASSTAVNVSFFYDSSRALYRIISVEGTKVCGYIFPSFALYSIWFHIKLSSIKCIIYLKSKNNFISNIFPARS